MLTPQELLDLPHNTPVRVIENYDPFFVGDIIYRNTKDGHDCEASCYFSSKPYGEGFRDYMTCEEVELVEEPRVSGEVGCANVIDKLGVFRPELETRKIGKIRVELVDHGFPLALREVANVMTWAQTAKGYKDHDWQNLPNAEVALEAAASRHRTDHIKQRVVDELLIERCVDPESGLLHKAHEAFGVLAQLELMLRGSFDLGVDSRL